MVHNSKTSTVYNDSLTCRPLTMSSFILLSRAAAAGLRARAADAHEYAADEQSLRHGGHPRRGHIKPIKQ